MQVSAAVLASATVLLVACRGGARTPRDVQIPVFTPTTAPQVCLNDRYPAGAPEFAGDQFEYRTLPSGLQVFDISAGTGATPSASSTVSVRFTGFLPDGCIFTTSYVQDAPVEIDLTASIDGIQEGVSTMQVGGNRRLRIPATLGYGAQGVPGRVPANSPVVFVIDLAGIVDRSATSTPPTATTTPATTPDQGTPSAGSSTTTPAAP
jgi:hypothetical protein